MINKKAFTLIELIVGITISVLLMTSIVVFVSSGLNNINFQQKLLQDNYETSFFFGDFKNIINKTSKEIYILCPSGICKASSSSGILLKLDKNGGKGGFIFTGEKEFDNFFCKNGSENTKTKHIFIKKFIPFESIGGDNFSGSSYNSGNIITNYFSGTIFSGGNSLSGNYFSPNDVVLGISNDLYVSDTINHSILKFDKSNSSIAGTVIVGKEAFGDLLNDGDSATGVYLNSPTGLAFGEGKLFISDTLNNRILYLSGTQIYKLLDSYDGLSEPTGLFYSNIRKSLLISNSGKGEILEYSSFGSVIPNLKISFSPKSNFSSNKFEIEFLTGGSISSISMMSPTTTGSYSFSGFNQNSDLGTVSGNKLVYSFLDNTGTGIFQLFNSGSSYGIDISNISGTNLNQNSSYFVKLSLFSGSITNYIDYYQYYINGDNLITTNKDNTIKIITGGLNYPTGIYFDGNDILVNDFIKRKNIKLTITGSFISSSDLQQFDFSVFNYNKNFDNILSVPIKSFDFNISNNLLSILLKYYKSYNCYNLDEKVERTLMLKKNL